jgi:hypothetical protein
MIHLVLYRCNKNEQGTSVLAIIIAIGSIHQSDRGLSESFGTHFDVTMIPAHNNMFITDD